MLCACAYPQHKATWTRGSRLRSRRDTPQASSGGQGGPTTQWRGPFGEPVRASPVATASSRPVRLDFACARGLIRSAAKGASVAGAVASFAGRSRTTKASRAPPRAPAGRRGGSRAAPKLSHASSFASDDEAARACSPPATRRCPSTRSSAGAGRAIELTGAMSARKQAPGARVSDELWLSGRSAARDHLAFASCPSSPPSCCSAASA
jgi:hypothetical protein